MATVSEQVLGQILHVETAHEAWVELERSYGTHTPLRIMMLKKELNFIKKDGGDMVSYLDHVKSLANTLAAAGHPISPPDLIQITLNGLPEEYESLVTSVTTSATIEKLTFNGDEGEILIVDDEEVVFKIKDDRYILLMLIAFKIQADQSTFILLMLITMVDKTKQSEALNVNIVEGRDTLQGIVGMSLKRSLP
ncbi:hypothetical protein EJ110_NYTH58486 [Nymphaea thermarum]|nr:hypothetical protein EJ110_NYTH58486 [Nymphaea thermarum]